MNSGLDPLKANMAFVEEFLDNAEGVAFDLDDDKNGWYMSPPEFTFAGSMDALQVTPCYTLLGLISSHTNEA